MTKKDYILFADMLAKTYNETADEKEHKVLEIIRERITEIFKADNERFNSDKFNEYITKKTTG